VLAARSAEALERVASECRAFNTKAVAVPTDVSSEEACRKLMEAALKAFGQIDVLVLNAGVGCHHSFSDTRFARVIERVAGGSARSLDFGAATSPSLRVSCRSTSSATSSAPSTR
jgi:NAD(P)-dependent dehydrogenase (short-subunit alcohol dehydrogenase family)